MPQESTQGGSDAADKKVPTPMYEVSLDASSDESPDQAACAQSSELKPTQEGVPDKPADVAESIRSSPTRQAGALTRAEDGDRSKEPSQERQEESPGAGEDEGDGNKSSAADLLSAFRKGWQSKLRKPEESPTLKHRKRAAEESAAGSAMPSRECSRSVSCEPAAGKAPSREPSRGASLHSNKETARSPEASHSIRLREPEASHSIRLREAPRKDRSRSASSDVPAPASSRKVMLVARRSLSAERTQGSSHSSAREASPLPRQSRRSSESAKPEQLASPSEQESEQVLAPGKRKKTVKKRRKRRTHEAEEAEDFEEEVAKEVSREKRLSKKKKKRRKADVEEEDASSVVALPRKRSKRTQADDAADEETELSFEEETVRSEDDCDREEDKEDAARSAASQDADPPEDYAEADDGRLMERTEDGLARRHSKRAKKDKKKKKKSKREKKELQLSRSSSQACSEEAASELQERDDAFRSDPEEVTEKECERSKSREDTEMERCRAAALRAFGLKQKLAALKAQNDVDPLEAKRVAALRAFGLKK